MIKLDESFWFGKKVLITGHTGFKGAWLSLILHAMGARVFGLSLAPLTTPSLYGLATKGIFENEIILDLVEKQKVEEFIREITPEIIFHLAAQASVLEGYKNPIKTWNSNVIGTLNILEGISNLDSTLTLIVATTDKVYANSNQGKDFKETDSLGGSDPYSSSKVAVEELITSYRRIFQLKKSKIKVGVGRAGNVIGGGDFLPDRIFPDALRAIESQTPLFLRNPHSTRPWQHVFDPLSGYISLAEKLSTTDKSELESAFNFSNSANLGISVNELLSLVPKEFKLKIREIDEVPTYYEAKSLNLDSSKAEQLINWTPRIGIQDAVRLTFDWNREYLKKSEMGAFSRSQVEEFLNNEN